MRIRAGLVGPSRPWEGLLTQEGFPYSLVNLREVDPTGRYSVVIVHRQLDSAEREVLDSYLRHGGAILGDMSNCEGIGGMAAHEEYVKYLTGEGPPFLSVGLCDLETKCAIPREAHVLRTDGGTFGAYAGELAGGWAVFLPFPPDLMMADQRAASKAFYSPLDRFPSERVSVVAKGEIQHLVHESLHYLHAMRGMPYAHLWYFPGLASNVFAFRVDTDGAERGDVDRLYHAGREYDIGFSWFLHVKSHESWLQHFVAMTGQEMAVHCYEHRPIESYEQGMSDIGRAKRILESVGVHPQGFAAPYGGWNPSVASATRALGFRYSSEFSYAYDALPFHPATVGEILAPLQLPIHPISVGSLRQAGYAPSQMRDYFDLVVRWKRARQEPLIFYHHPSHREWGVVQGLLEAGKAEGVRSLTFAEYATWWERRSRATPELKVEKGRLEVDAPFVVQASESGIALRVVRPDGRHSLLPVQGSVDLSLLSWHERSMFEPPDDIRRVREFDPRRVLGSLYNSMLRRMR